MARRRLLRDRFWPEAVFCSAAAVPHHV